ncbi:hypothetical protein VMCG_06778 [Cytospora schulzeri]|uniref:Uncharacterized protein n=1 Tax=Cytospora schulzeri TaxID=448051 RepID=A0A423W5R0_9PEZI|nr:hypothetical protein VMCG_06778 [Valsa malicola]
MPTPLQMAARQGALETAVLLLRCGADVNAPASIGNRERRESYSALDEAAGAGRLDMAKLLLNVDALSHVQGDTGYDGAIRFAEEQSHFAVAELIRQHADETRNNPALRSPALSKPCPGWYEYYDWVPYTTDDSETPSGDDVLSDFALVPEADDEEAANAPECSEALLSAKQPCQEHVLAGTPETASAAVVQGSGPLSGQGDLVHFAAESVSNEATNSLIQGSGYMEWSADNELDVSHSSAMMNLDSLDNQSYGRNDLGESQYVPLGSANLAPYATVSRRWQHPIEAMTFAHITLDPARLASPLAAQALTPHRVRRFVRSVRVDVVLPTYDEAARGRHEDDAERGRADAVFTDVVRKDGGRAGKAGPTPGYCSKIHLFMTARCVSDTEDIEARKYRRRVGAMSTEDIFEARYESSYLDLRPAAGKSVEEEAEALPELRWISKFHVSGTPPLGVGEVQGSMGLGVRHFAPRALCLMASRMSGLESINWQLCDNEKRDVALRKRLRACFANTLQRLPPTLQHFELLYERHPPSDHSYQTPSILEETDNSNDKLSLALHKLSQHLTTLTVMASVGPEIFWPPEQSPEPGQQQQQHQQEDDKPPLWPSMRRYIIDPGVIAPSGAWRFRRPLDEPVYSDDGADSYVSDFHANVFGPGDQVEDPFREEVDPDAVNPLLLAAARAAGRMPALLSLDFGLDAGRLDVWYKVNRGGPSAGGSSNDSGVVSGAVEVLVESHSRFYPDESVMRAWRNGAREHVGAESGLEVTVNDSRWSLDGI